MAIGGQGTGNFLNQLKTVFNFVKNQRKFIPSTTDNLVLRLHYQFTFYYLIFMFSAVWYSWYNKDVLTCINSFNADVQIRQDFLNICFTYIYLPLENGGRRYLFFYRYLHWIVLAVAALYYFPRKFSRHYDDLRAKKLLNDIIAFNSKGDLASEKALCERSVKYMRFYLGGHSRIYLNNVLSALIALCVDILAFHLLDYVLHGRYINYGIMSIPFNRDPEYYTDYMSQTFPPFVRCQIGEIHKLANKRVENFGCHLTIMELYEKLFMFLWFWMIILTGITVCYIIFLCFFGHPFFRNYILRRGNNSRIAKEEDDLQDVIATVVKTSKIGDVFVLYLIKGIVSPTRFYMILCQIADPELQDVTVDSKPEQHNNVQQQQNTMPNKPKGSQMTQAEAQAFMMMQARKGNGPMRRQ